MKFKFWEILSWLLVVLLVVLVTWRVFGNGPSEWSVFGVVAGFVLVQVFGFGERITRLEMGTKNGFYNMKKDVGLMENKLDLVCEKLEVAR